MKLYAALLIDGSEEDRPRVPADIHLAAEPSSHTASLKLAQTIEVGPATVHGNAALCFFTSEVSDGSLDNLFLQIGFGPISPGQTIVYRPD